MTRSRSKALNAITMSRLAFFALGAFVFTIPWENVVQLDAFGTISRVVGYAAVGIGGITILAGGRVRAPGAIHIQLIVLICLVGASILWTVDRLKTVTELLTYGQLLAMVWLIWELAPDMSRQLKLMEAYVAGCVVCAAGTFHAYANGVAFGNRYSAEGMNPNELAIAMAIGIPFAWHVASQVSRRVARFASLAYIPVAAAVIILTGSRGGGVAGLAAILIIPLTARRMSRVQKAGILVAFVGVGIALIELAPPTSLERLLTTKDQVTKGDMGNRTELWAGGLRQFPKNPVLGIGAGGYSVGLNEEMGNNHVAHNTFLSILVELGIVGFGLLGILMATAAWSAWTMPGVYRTLWFVVFIVWALAANTGSLEYRKVTWLLLALMAAQAAAMSKPMDQHGRRMAPFTSHVEGAS